MDFVSIRIVSDNVARLVEFYERVTGLRASWANENFAELSTASATLAIARTRTVPLFGPGAAESAANRSVIIEFFVDDVDSVYASLTGYVEDFVNQPTTMPWGNRSLLFRDPDGNLVNLFTPVTQVAREKFGRGWSTKKLAVRDNPSPWLPRRKGESVWKMVRRLVGAGDSVYLAARGCGEWPRWRVGASTYRYARPRGTSPSATKLRPWLNIPPGTASTRDRRPGT